MCHTKKPYNVGKCYLYKIFSVAQQSGICATVNTLCRFLRKVWVHEDSGTPFDMDNAEDGNGSSLIFQSSANDNCADTQRIRQPCDHEVVMSGILLSM